MAGQGAMLVSLRRTTSMLDNTNSSNPQRKKRPNQRMLLRFLGLILGYVLWYFLFFLRRLRTVKHDEGIGIGIVSKAPWNHQGNMESIFKELLRKFKMPTRMNFEYMNETLPPKEQGTVKDHKEVKNNSYLVENATSIEPEVTATYRWVFDPVRLKIVQKVIQKRISRLTPALTAYVETSPAILIEEQQRKRLSWQNTSTLHPNQQREPLRTQSPKSLKEYTYNQLQKCSDMPSKFPVNQPVELNKDYKNTNNRTPLFSKKFHYATYCPVDADPYLPWIHDVFPSVMNMQTSTVEYIEILAQNKRRCNTDDNRFANDLKNLEPQVAIMQPVPVKRISSLEAHILAPELWSGQQKREQQKQQQHQSLLYNNTNPSSSIVYDNTIVDSRAAVSRYRLATYEDADTDSQETRFICRFHTMDLDDDDNGNDGKATTIHRVILGETLSIFPYNYEYVSWRKDSYPMLSKGGSGANNCFWNSVQHFRCPIPSHLQKIIGREESVINDAATIFLDLVPIRTRVRLGDEQYFTVDMAGDYAYTSTFDPHKEWGDAHVLPEIEASGRWENIPLCASPTPNKSPNEALAAPTIQNTKANHTSLGEKNTLVGCVWASAQFTTRGNSPLDSSTSSRLLEWLTYHLFIANMDHIYVYDNSGAHDREVSLANITSLFPNDRVTRIDWPFQVCNNNAPTHPNAGERSSQYAAEASCRLRFGPFTEFLASLDIDEYLIPMGNWTDLKHWIKEGVSNITNILTFKSVRASPNYEYMQPYWDGEKCGMNESDARCVIQRPDALYLETYNCGKKVTYKSVLGKRKLFFLSRSHYLFFDRLIFY